MEGSNLEVYIPQKSFDAERTGMAMCALGLRVLAALCMLFALALADSFAAVIVLSLPLLLFSLCFCLQGEMHACMSAKIVHVNHHLPSQILSTSTGYSTSAGYSHFAGGCERHFTIGWACTKTTGLKCVRQAQEAPAQSHSRVA